MSVVPALLGGAPLVGHWFNRSQEYAARPVQPQRSPFSSTPEQGADSLIWLATSPEAASLKGEYVSKRRPATPQKQALDPKLAADRLGEPRGSARCRPFGGVIARAGTRVLK